MIYKTLQEGAPIGEIGPGEGYVQVVSYRIVLLDMEMGAIPWLDIGNHQPLRPSMTVSCEPGIYETGYAGFRHSDTVLVTKNGMEQLTHYPRDIDELITHTSKL